MRAVALLCAMAFIVTPWAAGAEPIVPVVSPVPVDDAKLPPGSGKAVSGATMIACAIVQFPFIALGAYLMWSDDPSRVRDDSPIVWALGMVLVIPSTIQAIILLSAGIP